MSPPVTRRTRAAVAIAMAIGLLVMAASMTTTYNGENAGATVGRPECSVGVEWRGDPGLFVSCAGSDPDVPGDDNHDGRIDEDESGWDCATMGNRQCGPSPAPVSIVLPVDCTGPGGCTVEGLPDECQGARDATALCVTVATRPPYGWTNPDGSRVDNPDGRAQLRDLTERPGTPEFAAALRALDAEWREHH